MASVLTATGREDYTSHGTRWQCTAKTFIMAVSMLIGFFMMVKARPEAYLVVGKQDSSRTKKCPAKIRRFFFPGPTPGGRVN